MMSKKEIKDACEILAKHNSKILAVYEVPSGNIQMDAYGKESVWRAFLNTRGLPVLEIIQHKMRDRPYVLIVFGYPEIDTSLTVESVVNRHREWESLPEGERPTAAFSFDELLQIASSYVGLFEDTKQENES